METRQEIKDIMTNYFIESSVVKNIYNLEPGKTFLQQFSLVSIENIFFDTISYALFIMIKIFQKRDDEIEIKIKHQKSGRLPWYQKMILNYQHGFMLLPENDVFDNTGASVEEIENSKKIKYCSVNNGDKPGIIIIKIAGEDKKPVSESIREGVKSYVERIGWAGNEFRVINNLPDKIVPHLVVYRDATVLDANGVSSRDGSKPVEDAIYQFMKELPFNGELVLQSFVDKIQKVQGVNIVDLKYVESSWISANSSTNQYNESTVINVKKIPESGYYEVDNLQNISYVV